MSDMRRFTLAFAAALAFSAVATATAATPTTVEVGLGNAKVIAPTCPKGTTKDTCTIVMSQVTAYATIRNGKKSPDLVTANGEITKFSVGESILSNITSTRKKYFNQLTSDYGGAPSAQLTVLAPIGNPALRRFRVAAQSPVYTLTNYMGKVATFTLAQPLPVVRGETLALTTPTWVAALTIQRSTTRYIYAQSRTTCSSAGSADSDVAQSSLADMASYGCFFVGTSLEFSATEVKSTS